MTNKHCNECGELVEFNGRACADYNIDINDDIICGECGIKSHCFCDDCGEYVPTSHCTMNDYTEVVDGIEIDVSEVICDVCEENKGEK